MRLIWGKIKQHCQQPLSYFKSEIQNQNGEGLNAPAAVPTLCMRQQV
jgi:hypothetical protein